MMNWHEKYKSAQSFEERLADRITKYLGSTVSVIFHTGIFIYWFFHRLDVNLLTNIVSLEAIYLAIFIQMTANRNDKYAKAQAEHDLVSHQQLFYYVERIAKHFDID